MPIDMDERIRTSIESVTTIMNRAQVLRRRWVGMARPMSDSSPQDALDIEQECHVLTDQLLAMGEDWEGAQLRSRQLDAQLAGIRNLLKSNMPDIAALRAVLQ